MTASDRAMADVDRAAAAIMREMRGEDWDSAADVSKIRFRAMAGAALNALGVIEETRELVRMPGDTHGWVNPLYAAPYHAMGLTPPPAVITHERRLVTVWTEYDA